MFGLCSGFACVGCASFKPFWPLAFVQQALAAMFFVVRGLCGHFRFCVLGLTRRSSRPAYCGRLILFVRPSLTNIGELGMLQLRPSCECCDKDLLPESADARICSFECTFCSSCAEGVLAGKCPNCGGELVARPRRPASKLANFPASTERIVKPHGCKEAA